MIINAKNLLLGRFATVAAKKALLGEKVVIINCEEAIISGKKNEVLKRYKARVARGIPLKGPYHHRRSDMLVRRAVRGMIPWKRDKGREAYKRIMCYVGTPKDYENKKYENIKGANYNKLPTLKSLKVKELCKLLGAKQ